MKFNKKLLTSIVLAFLLITAGCASQTESSGGEKLAEEMGEDVKDVKPGESVFYEMKKTEKNQIQLVKRQPPEGMDTSLERQNLVRRNQFLNNQNEDFYVYLLSDTGQVVTRFVAKGKVSSVNSKLTNTEQIVRIPGCNDHNGGNDCWKKVDSPQMDGSYGTNGDGIFFFTADGRYVEWNGKYIVSQEPLGITDPVILTQDADDTRAPDTGNETNSTSE